VDKLVTEPRAYIAYLEESLDKALAAAARADAYAAKLAEQEERMEEMQKSISNLGNAQKFSINCSCLAKSPTKKCDALSIAELAWF
jgi:phage-related minor tail protein